MILIHPGLNNSGPQHWQSLWQKKYSDAVRVEQRDWDTPECSEWIATLDAYVMRYELEEVILVGHSLACTTFAYWADKYNRKIKGALLVGPSDTEANSYPSGTKGFKPVPLLKLPFPSIVVASSDDFYVTLERATQFADAWGSTLVNIGPAGHINAASGFGEWEFGETLLKNFL